jgi:N-methylhydantoinase A/oxoprolinase/acetone carboxylase beta subunit
MERRYVIDVDVGGTFTDGLFSDLKSITSVKVDTTPHDLTVCFFSCLEEGAKKLGFADVRELLEHTDMIRWSTTIASNVLAQRTGPKLGLLVSKGHKSDLYTSTAVSPAVNYLVDADAVIEVSEDPTEEEILTAVRSLLTSGVRRIVVGLKGSFYDPKGELKIKSVLSQWYPDHLLGSVPVLLGSDIYKHPDDATRVHVALLNAYTHDSLATALFKADDELRSRGYEKFLLAGQISGGAVSIYKLRAIDTIESGPVMGIFGSAYWAEMYGLKNVVTLDVGGTTTKVGVVREGKPVMEEEPSVFGIPLKVPLVLPLSLALGGGTVAKVEDKTLTLGPESMGAYPGPACYNLGGTEATLTDAFVLLGYINPKYFSGGARVLDVERAQQAIEEKVADPMGVAVEEAANRIVEKASDLVAEAIKKRLQDVKVDVGECSLFAFGGNGPLLGPIVADRMGMKEVYVFSLSAVFSCFGSHMMDVMHTYEYALLSPLLPKVDYATFNRVVSSMREEALGDLRAEGFEAEKASLTLELELTDGKNPPIRVSHPFFLLKDEKDTEAILASYDKAAPSFYDRKNVIISMVRLKAVYSTDKYTPPAHPPGKADPKRALKGKRVVRWIRGPATTNIYDWDLLACGNVVSGPAIIEGKDTTYVVPEGWKLEVDRYLNGVLRRVR